MSSTAFAKSFYKETLLNREFFSTTQKFFTHTHSSYGQRHIRREALKLLHRKVFTQKSFYTSELLHTDMFEQHLLHREAFTKKSLYTEEPVHTDAFTQRIIYAHALHTPTHTRLYAEKPLH